MVLGATLAASTSWSNEPKTLKLIRQEVPEKVLKAIDDLYSETRHERDFGGISYIEHFKAAPGFTPATLVHEVLQKWIQERRWYRLNSFCDHSKAISSFSSCLEAIHYQRGPGRFQNRMDEIEAGVDDHKSSLRDAKTIRDFVRKSLGSLSYGNAEYFLSTGGLNVDEDLHLLFNSKTGDILLIESDIGA